MRIPIPITVVLAAALAFPAAVAASPIIVVAGGHQKVVDDPFLAPPAPADLAIPAVRPPTAVASDGKVMAVLRASLATGRITRSEYDGWRQVYIDALNTRAGLGGRCRSQLGAVINQLQRLARTGKLTASRMPVLFLQLRRNAEFWATEPNIPDGGRVTFKNEFVIWQHYPGQGLQFQPLANWGRAAAVAEYCRLLGRHCVKTKGSLGRRIDKLITLASIRHGFTTWEYFFSFGGGTPPWISGMAQGTALQALAIGAQVLHQAFYLQVGRASLGAFQQKTPAGVAVPADGGRHYALYSFAPGERVLNGFLQAVLGLQTFADATKDPLAMGLAKGGDRAARVETPRYDTGSWSYYERPGHEQSSVSYHILLRDFLRRMCRRTGAKVYCRTAAKFTSYLRKRGIPDNGPEAGGANPAEESSGPRCGV